MDVTLVDLWLPIVLSGVAVFFLSFVMWMVLPHHRSDWGKVKNEDEVMDTLGDIERGQYMFPHCGSPADMKDPEWISKRDRGPSGMLVVMARGPMNMGTAMAHSLFFNLIMSIAVAYVGTIVFAKGIEDDRIFRVLGTVAFLGYSGALAWNAVWFHQSWSSTFKSMFDGLVYGLATGYLFHVMWP